MDIDERSKLKKIIEHWIGHNQEHCREFEEWAEKARRMGESDVAGGIDRAVGALKIAGEMLEQSLKKIEGA